MLVLAVKSLTSMVIYYVRQGLLGVCHWTKSDWLCSKERSIIIKGHKSPFRDMGEGSQERN